MFGILSLSEANCKGCSLRITVLRIYHSRSMAGNVWAWAAVLLTLVGVPITIHGVKIIQQRGQQAQCALPRVASCGRKFKPHVERAICQTVLDTWTVYAAAGLREVVR